MQYDRIQETFDKPFFRQTGQRESSRRVIAGGSRINAENDLAVSAIEAGAYIPEGVGAAESTGERDTTDEVGVTNR